MNSKTTFISSTFKVVEKKVVSEYLFEHNKYVKPFLVFFGQKYKKLLKTNFLFQNQYSDTNFKTLKKETGFRVSIFGIYR